MQINIGGNFEFLGVIVLNNAVLASLNCNTDIVYSSLKNNQHSACRLNVNPLISIFLWMSGEIALFHLKNSSAAP